MGGRGDDQWANELVQELNMYGVIQQKVTDHSEVINIQQ
jgi:hypothetical protein